MEKMRCKHALRTFEVVNQSATATGMPVNKDKITCSKRVTVLSENKTTMLTCMYICVCVCVCINTCKRSLITVKIHCFISLKLGPHCLNNDICICLPMTCLVLLR